MLETNGASVVPIDRASVFNIETEEHRQIRDAASICRKLGFEIDRVRLPADWTCIGEPSYSYQQKTTKIILTDRPARADIEFRLVREIFLCFEEVILPKFTMLHNDDRKYIIQQIRDCGLLLSNMAKAAFFKDEPAIFFNFNWPIILLVYDKLSRVRLFLQHFFPLN